MYICRLHCNLLGNSMKRTLLSLGIVFIMANAAVSQSLERPKKQVSLVSEVVSQLDKAIGWTLQNNGAWISADNKIPFKEYSLNKINKGRYLLGIENFTTIEARQVIVLDQIYSILIIKYIDGKYEFPILEQNWSGFEALKYYVFNQNRWNKVLPNSPEFNKPYAVNMNLLCSGTMANFNQKTYLFEIENHVQKAVFQKEESVSNLIIAVYPVEIAGNKIIRFKFYETLNKKELYSKYLLSYNWEKLFKSYYYEIKFIDFKDFTDNILVIDPKRLADIDYYLTFLERGMRSYDKENFVTASQNFSKALMVHPPDTAKPSCFLWRGKSYLNIKLFDYARTDFDSVLKRVPENQYDSLIAKEAYFERGNCNKSLYEYANACNDWQKSYNYGFNEAYKIIKKNCNIEGDSSLVVIDTEKAGNYFHQAMKKFEESKYLKSLFLFEEAWKSNPTHNDFRLPYYIGVCRFNTGDFVRSIDDFEKAYQMKPDESSHDFNLWLDAIVMKGKALQNINNQFQACEEWNKAHRFGSFDASELINKHCFAKHDSVEQDTTIVDHQSKQIEIGVSYYEKGDFEKSIEVLTTALPGSTDEENLLIYNYRASAKHKIHDYQGAIDDFTKAIEKRPSDQKYYLDWLRAWFNRGVSKYYFIDFKGACNDWKQAIDMGLEDIEALYYYNNYCEE